MSRLDVRKTYKLYIGGTFPRSESGRSYEVVSASGRVPRQRLDGLAQGRARRGRRRAWRLARLVGRDARSTAARCSTAWPRCSRAAGPSSSTRSRASEGLTARAAATVVDAAIDRVVWYAGWTDKIAQVLGNLNPVAGPYFNVSAPEPTGVVGVLAPQASSLLGLVSVVAPVIASGNTAVVVTSADRPLPAVTLRRGARHLRRARVASSTSSRRAPPRSPRGSPRTATSTPST